MFFRPYDIYKDKQDAAVYACMDEDELTLGSLLDATTGK
jgi:hypothetical protein